MEDKICVNNLWNYRSLHLYDYFTFKAVWYDESIFDIYMLANLIKLTKIGNVGRNIPWLRRLCWQPKQVLGKLRLESFWDGVTSSNITIGNRWWYDLAKWGEEIRVNPHTRHSVGSSQTRTLHLGQVYPPPVLASSWHVHIATEPSADRCGKPILIKLAVAYSAIAGGGGACSRINYLKWDCTMHTFMNLQTFENCKQILRWLTIF